MMIIGGLHTITSSAASKCCRPRASRWIRFAFLVILTGVIISLGRQDQQEEMSQQGVHGTIGRGQVQLGGVLLQLLVPIPVAFAKDTDTLLVARKRNVGDTPDYDDYQNSSHHPAAAHPHHSYLRMSSSFQASTGTSIVQDDDNQEAKGDKEFEQLQQVISPSERVMVQEQCKMDRGIELFEHVLKGAFSVTRANDAWKVSEHIYSNLSSGQEADITKLLDDIQKGDRLSDTVQNMLDIFQVSTTYTSVKRFIDENNVRPANLKLLDKFFKNHNSALKEAKNSLTSYMTTSKYIEFQKSIKECFEYVVWECRDNIDYVYVDMVEFNSRTCSQISKLESSFRLKLCKIPQVSENCPFSCGTCCVDDPNFTIGPNDASSCSWLTEGENRIAQYCENILEDGKMISYYCPKSCGTCFSAYLDYGYEMKAESTVSYDILSLGNWSQENVEWEVSLISRYTNMTFEFPPKKCFRGIEEKQEIASLISSISDGQNNNTDGGVKTLVIPSAITTSLPSECIAETKIKIVLPRSVYTMCVGEECNPILCPIVAGSPAKCISQMMNFVPANTAVLFGDNKDCSIIEPDNWRDWVDDHYSFVEENQRFDTSFYFADVDGDCVSNILEHYGLDLTKLYVDSFGPGLGVRIAQRSSFSFGSPTNPNKEDSDGDSLTDAYELLFGSPPNMNHDRKQNLRDMILTYSSLYDADSDMDGFSDNDEMIAATNAMDARSVPPSNTEKQLTVQVVMTVGDESGSNSEKWRLRVGHINVTNTYFGKLVTETHQLPEGDYKITMEHVESRFAVPDTDYTALVKFEDDKNFLILIEDDDKLLGRHHVMDIRSESPTATLRIRRKGFGEDCLYSTCSQCNSKTICLWDQAFRICRPFDPSSPFHKDGIGDCACTKCMDWASANQNMTWIEKLPLCPCTVQEFSNGSFSWLGLTDEQQAQYVDVDWVTDMACNPTWGCDERPGAKGCILSTTSESHLGGQQCCYGMDLKLLDSGSKSVGNAHRSHFSLLAENWLDDLRPYHLCCSDCEDDTACESYIKKSHDNRQCIKAP